MRTQQSLLNSELFRTKNNNMFRRVFIKRTLPALGLILVPQVLRPKMRNVKFKVLLLGDSISIGYTPFVQKQLEGVATVVRPLHKNGSNENCQGTTNGVKHIDRWLKGENWDVIHFNFGLHDLKKVDPITGKNSTKKEDPNQADIKQYKKNLKRIVKKLKETRATLVFATTTPYPDHPSGPLRETGLPELYNEVALKIMRKNDILVNDLHSFVVPKMEELMIPNNVHFTKKGSRTLATEVATIIKKVLKN